MADTIGSLADEYWDAWMAAAPAYATTIGDHRFDDQLGPVTHAEIEEAAAGIGSIADRAEALDGLTPEDALTQEILVVNARNLIRLVSVGIFTAPISPYLGVHATLPQYLSRSAATEPSHAEMLLIRVRSVPEHLHKVEQRQRVDIEEGIVPTVTNLQRVVGQIDASLAAPIDDDPYLSIAPPADWHGVEAWRADLRHAVEEGIRPALARYREFLADVVTVRARSDDEPGLRYLPDGEHRYAEVIRFFTSLDRSPDEIHQIGRDETEGGLWDEFAEIGEEAFGISDAAQVIHRLIDDPELRYSTEDEMLSHARRTIERAWAAVPPWFGTMPSEPCEVVPVPATLAPSMPPAYYAVGAPDGTRPGTYYLNTHAPGTRTRFDAEAIAHHEAIPGHHFDRTLAAELTGIPRFRRYGTEIAHAEGWGLYAERLADEVGLYSTPVDRLGMVASDAWRAIRLVVDTGIHHLGWTREQAVRYFADHAPTSRETIEVEVDRYISMPGQALAYKMGQREILRLRQKARSAMGDRFTHAGFHDVVLANGSIPLTVLGRLVDDWIAAD